MISQEDALPENQHPSPTRVFVLEDHQMVRQGLRLLIEQERDLEVCGESASAAEAIGFLRAHKPDIVLADVSLPGTNGIEFLKNLKAEWPEMRAIVVSMHDESIYAERALRAGARGYVMKRAAIEEVIDGIRAVLAGEYFVSKNVTGVLFHKALRNASQGKEASASPLQRLSDREMEVFELLGRGKSTRQIAETLHLSVKTVETHRAHIKEKLKIPSNDEMLQHAAVWVEHSCTA